MSFIAVAIGGSALIGAGASLAGSSAQAGAANRATSLQQQEFDQTQANQAPFVKAGQAAVGQEGNLLGLNGADAQTDALSQFRSDPGYQFDVNQAVQGVDRSAAARGLLTSGATIKAIQDRASSLADQQYGNYFSRLAGVAGQGQTATQATSQAGSTAATNSGNFLVAGANAGASGYNGVASAANEGLNNYFAYKGIQNGGSGYGSPFGGLGWGSATHGPDPVISNLSGI